MLIMAWELNISSFNVSLSTEIRWISLCRSLISLAQLGGTDEVRLAVAVNGEAGATGAFSLGSIDSIRENSRSAEIAVVVADDVVVAAVVVVDEQ